MSIRTVTRENQNGSVRYVQMAHNYRNPKTGKPQAQILYNFGRETLTRLAKSIFRYLAPEHVEEIQSVLSQDWPFEFLGARQLGGTWFLDGLWKKLGIAQVLKRLLSQRDYKLPIERMLFAMVANRCLAPSSKLAIEHWAKDEVLIDELPEVEVHQLDRAIDFLIGASEEIQHQVFTTVADLFNIEVDLMFLDTTTTYFEIEGEVIPGLRKRGYSKDCRPNQAQAVVAFAVTRNGIAVRCWVWPGNTADKAMVEQVKSDLNGWRMGRVVLVADAGFNSERNKRVLQGASGHCILSEKLRQGPKGTSALPYSTQVSLVPWATAYR